MSAAVDRRRRRKKQRESNLPLGKEELPTGDTEMWSYTCAVQSYLKDIFRLPTYFPCSDMEMEVSSLFPPLVKNVLPFPLDSFVSLSTFGVSPKMIFPK